MQDKEYAPLDRQRRLMSGCFLLLYAMIIHNLASALHGRGKKERRNDHEN